MLYLITLLNFVKNSAILKRFSSFLGLSQAIGIWAKDGEYVPLVNAVQCVGQVESWLNAFVAEMRSSLRHLLKEAVAGYDERPKDSWIWDYPAQVALTASQIAWNAEVTSAFQKLEEGYENAMKDLSRKQVKLTNRYAN